MKSFRLALALLVAVAGCSPTARESAPTSVASPAHAITDLPVTVSVKQRSTTAVPGTKDELLITIDDITRGQVIVSLVHKNGEAILGPHSLKSDDAIRFYFGNSDYFLRLAKLNDALLGEDFASFVISSSETQTLSEEQKIEQLLKAVESLSDAVFLRNDKEYSAKEAAKHLRQKWAAASGEIKSATSFIDLVASKSSLTGESYQIRHADGRIILVRDFLREELERLDTSQ